MSSVTINTADDLNKVSSATSTFLSSFASIAASGSEDQTLFTNLLSNFKAETGATSASVAPKPAVPSTQAATSAQATSVQAETSSSNSVEAALRKFVDKWHAYKKSVHDQEAKSTAGKLPLSGTAEANATEITKAKAALAGAKATALAANGTAPTSDATTSPATTTTDPSQNANQITATAAATTSTGAPPTLAELLQQLQQLLQLVQQQKNAGTLDLAANAPSSTSGSSDPAADLNGILAALNVGAVSTSGSSSSSNSASALTSAAATDPTLSANGDILAGLFLLARSSGAKVALAANASGGNADGAATTATSSNAPTSAGAQATLDAQLKTDLASLVDALKGLQQAQAGGPSDINTNPVSSTLTESLSTETSTKATATTSSSTAALNDNLSSDLGAADDFVKQLNALFTANAPRGAEVNPTPSSSTALPLLPTGSKDGALSDATTNGGTSNGSATANADASTSANVLAGNDSGKASNPYSFASQLSASRAANGGTTGLPTAIEQAMLQISRNVKSGNDQMTLQLHPAELGTINIKLSIASDGSVQGNVIASHQATLDMMQKDQKGLERALQDAGLRADSGSLQFSLGGQFNNQSGQASHNSNGSNGANKQNADDGTVLALNETTDTTESWVLTPGRVNMKV